VSVAADAAKGAMTTNKLRHSITGMIFSTNFLILVSPP